MCSMKECAWPGTWSGTNAVAELHTSCYAVQSAENAYYDACIATLTLPQKSEEPVEVSTLPFGNPAEARHQGLLPCCSHCL